MTQGEVTQQQGQALQAKLGSLRDQLAEVDGQLAIQEQQVSSNQELLERIQPLASKGYVSVFQIKQQQALVLDAQTQYKSLARQKLDIRQQVDATHQQLTQLPFDAASKRDED